MSGKSEKNPHKYHRQRMKKRFETTGLEGWSEHEILEVILYSCFTRKNTNDIAHALLSEFGSLENVLSASDASLQAVDNIGSQSSFILRFMGEVFKYLNFHNKSSMRVTEATLPKLLSELFFGKKRECMYAVYLDSSMRILQKRLMFEGDFDHIEIDAKSIFTIALKNNAEYVILAHNHPGGMLAPSSQDIETTQLLRDSLLFVGSKLLEHYIVYENKYVGILNYMKEHNI